ncbi:deoxyhypusine hydroxylase-like [Pecten maximus]|uniref:deoxyhypusine hydroxylase-like n=1 Tax=Pecten maximus TaxID=6579 RepID=UPI00145913C3|nr:deoxyhypusine hydroxylase-like [Pecten maximus]
MALASGDTLESIGKILNDKSRPLKDRFRALFTLKNIGGKDAIDSIAACFDDGSALLKHELAYCLGQMQDTYALPTLTRVLQDTQQEAMVRHEAGEALGAIGSGKSIEILQKYANDPVVEVAETCQLALERLEWLNSEKSKAEKLSTNPYSSVDPAPPSVSEDVSSLREVLLDESLSLFKRYRAMFSLRNNGSDEAVISLAEGLKCKSALFRHEIAYVLGQMQNKVCVKQLSENLKDLNESSMVRHECAEALGSIASEDCTQILVDYLKDSERVVKESCIVALDMSEYENSGQFQYADSLAKVQNVGSA